MSQDEEPIDYFDIGERPVREEHSIQQLDTPREMNQKLEQGEVEKPGDYLEFQRRKRKQIMQGFHQGLQEIDELEEKLEDGGFE
ncbi:hypothetical protein ACM16X_02665 [Haloarcula japonica]|uniref:hypothetical protein n=1 Tax=Haloarcula japonica TaxID=29282 RepID=UPI0039F70848